MNSRIIIPWGLWLYLIPVFALAEPAAGERGMVATVHPLATEAGIAVLKDGGNAVDAAVAAALMLGVVDGHNSGLGGGCSAWSGLRRTPLSRASGPSPA